jgi:hypothetical protein
MKDNKHRSLIKAKKWSKPQLKIIDKKDTQSGVRPPGDSENFTYISQ